MATLTKNTLKEGEKHDLLDYLDARVADLLERVQSTDYWKAITSPTPDRPLIRQFLKEIYLEIYGYQAQVIEATIAIIGQMPRALDDRKVRAMLIHQGEEFSHGEMALRDYVAMGGNEIYARTRKPSPAAFNTAAFWWMVQQVREPFMYLGALYLFEGLTPIVSGMIKPYLYGIDIPKESMEFLEFHSTEDIRHTNLVRQLIKDVTEKFPGAEDSAKHGLNCFLAVYPMPVWQTGWERAVVNVER